MTLSTVKAGDKLAINGGWNGISLITVERVTQTMVICKEGRFSKETGRAIGGSGYTVRSARIPDEDDYLEVRIKIAQRFIDTLKVNSENLDCVYSMIREIKLKEQP